MANFYEQTAKDQNAALLQAQTQAAEQAAQRQLTASQYIQQQQQQAQEYQQQMQAATGEFIQGQGQQAQEYQQGMQAGTGEFLQQQNVATQEFQKQQQAQAGQFMSQLSTGLSQVFQGYDQSAIQNAMSEFIRTNPEYSPLLNSIFSASSTFPPTVRNSYSPDLIALLGLIPSIISTIPRKPLPAQPGPPGPPGAPGAPGQSAPPAEPTPPHPTTGPPPVYTPPPPPAQGGQPQPIQTLPISSTSASPGGMTYLGGVNVGPGSPIDQLLGGQYAWPPGGIADLPQGPQPAPIGVNVGPGSPIDQLLGGPGTPTVSGDIGSTIYSQDQYYPPDYGGYSGMDTSGYGGDFSSFGF
jgi:hypothetical protein